MGWKWPSAETDNAFLRGMGIAPCDDLPDPYFRPPQGPPQGAFLTQADFELLRGMGVRGWLCADPRQGAEGSCTANPWGLCKACGRPWTRTNYVNNEIFGWCRECQALTPSPCPPPQVDLSRRPCPIDFDAAVMAAEDETFAGYAPPQDMRSLQSRYPNLMREAVRDAAPRLGYAVSGAALERLARQAGEALGRPVEEGCEEDAVGMYAAVPCPAEARTRWDAERHFLNYVRMRVLAALPGLLGEGEAAA
jgi:hypothetical protein